MNYIIFDLESTCGQEIPNVESEIIEIGAVKLNDKLDVVGEFQAFVKPVIHPTITYFCEELTSITQKDVDSARTFDDVIFDFNLWCREGDQSDYALCSWGFYDKKMLIQDSKRYGLKYGWVERNHISIKHQHGAMIGNKRGVGMNTALKMLGLELEGTHHRGIDDARNIAKIFVKIFDNLKFD